MSLLAYLAPPPSDQPAGSRNNTLLLNAPLRFELKSFTVTIDSIFKYSKVYLAIRRTVGLSSTLSSVRDLSRTSEH